MVNMILSENTWNLLQSIIHKYPQECFFDPNHFTNEIYLSIYPVLKSSMIFGRNVLIMLCRGLIFIGSFKI